MKDHAPEILSATTLIGNDVVNKEGKSLGKIEEIMLDRHSGNIAYAVLSFGGFLGMGDKLFAVPWRSMTVNTIEHNCLLDVNKEQLEDAPGFDKSNWPSSGDRKFLDSVYSYYKIEPYYAVTA